MLKLAAGSDTPTQMLQFTGLAWPSGVAADTHGGIYVADSKNNRVLKLAAGSDTPTPLPFDGLNGPLAAAVDNNDAVYVADTLNRRVLKLAAGSTTQDVLPVITPPLVAPVGVAVADGSSNVHVTDVDALRVYKLSRKAPRQQSELFSYSGLRGPKGVAVDRAGNVYVTDSSNRVLKLAANNSTPAPLAFTNLDGPTGVAVDNSNGNVYVADWGNNLVPKLPLNEGNKRTAITASAGSLLSRCARCSIQTATCEAGFAGNGGTNSQPGFGKARSPEDGKVSSRGISARRTHRETRPVSEVGWPRALLKGRGRGRGELGPAWLPSLAGRFLPCAGAHSVACLVLPAWRQPDERGASQLTSAVTSYQR